MGSRGGILFLPFPSLSDPFLDRHSVRMVMCMISDVKVFGMSLGIKVI